MLYISRKFQIVNQIFEKVRKMASDNRFRFLGELAVKKKKKTQTLRYMYQDDRYRTWIGNDGRQWSVPRQGSVHRNIYILKIGEFILYRIFMSEQSIDLECALGIRKYG